MELKDMLRIKEERGYSLAQIADYSGVPLGTVQKIFGGITKNPRRATMDALERVLLGDEDVYYGRAYEFRHRLVDSSDDFSGKCSYDYTQMMLTQRIPEMFREAAIPYGAYSYGTSAIQNKEGSGERKQGEYTTEDYLALPKEQRVELIDGTFYDMAAPSTVHQQVIGSFYFAVESYIRKKGGPCRVMLSPLDVQIDRDDRSMLQPDLLITCHPEQLTQKRLVGAPDFVLEVMSPSTARKDRLLKAYKYAQAGVREYWLIDPDKKTLTVHDFMGVDDSVVNMPLSGTWPMAIYQGDLMINLDELTAEIDALNETVGN